MTTLSTDTTNWLIARAKEFQAKSSRLTDFAAIRKAMAAKNLRYPDNIQDALVFRLAKQLRESRRAA